jgi:hypothetical protein
MMPGGKYRSKNRLSFIAPVPKLNQDSKSWRSGTCKLPLEAPRFQKGVSAHANLQASIIRKILSPQAFVRH